MLERVHELRVNTEGDGGSEMEEGDDANGDRGEVKTGFCSDLGGVPCEFEHCHRLFNILVARSLS